MLWQRRDGLGGMFHDWLILQARQPNFLHRLTVQSLVKKKKKICPRQVVAKSFHFEINSNRQLEPARMSVVLCKST